MAKCDATERNCESVAEPHQRHYIMNRSTTTHEVFATVRTAGLLLSDAHGLEQRVFAWNQLRDSNSRHDELAD